MSNINIENPDSLAVIQKVVLQQYGFDVELSRLPGENLNLLATDSAGWQCVVKLAAEDQSASFVEMEYLALLQASQRLPGTLFPTIIENQFGNIESVFAAHDGSSRRLRIINYLPGSSLDNSDISEQLLNNVGHTLAMFNQAMAGFEHPAAIRHHRWNLVDAGQHAHSIGLVQDFGKQKLLSWAFAEFAKISAADFAALQWQFIHGDPNPENILVEDNLVVGMLDFGDSCHNPRICDLAICLPYLMMGRQDLQATAAAVIEGYESVLPLTVLERQLLAPLVLGRLATTLSVAAQRRQIETNHPNWFVSEQPAWQLLGRLHEEQHFSFMSHL